MSNPKKNLEQKQQASKQTLESQHANPRKYQGANKRAAAELNRSNLTTQAQAFIGFGLLDFVDYLLRFPVGSMVFACLVSWYLRVVLEVYDRDCLMAGWYSEFCWSALAALGLFCFFGNLDYL